MKKFWFILKVIYLIVASMVMVWLGTECLDVVYEQWFSFNSVIGIVSAIAFYCTGYKGCRLALEEIVKEVNKNV